MAIKTDMLRYFVEVAHTGNLSDAAKNLGRTPSAVSMMLKQFEEHLGAPLFETERKSHLTALGKFTLEEAQRELFHFESTISSILKFAESGEGQVRIAAMPAAAANLMPKVITLIHEANPNILVDVEDMTNDAIVSRVQDETVDVGIVNEFSVSSGSNIKSALILTDKIGLLCARDSELGRKETLYWSDLAQTPIITHRLCDQINDPSVRKAAVNSRVRVASALSIQSFVRDGKYVSPMPELGSVSLPDDLVFRVPEGTTHRRKVYLIWNERHNPSPATLRFCKILQQVIVDMGMAPKTEDGQVIFGDMPK